MKKLAVVVSLAAVVMVPLLSADTASAGIGVLAVNACTPLDGSPVYAIDALYNSSTTTTMGYVCSVPSNFSGLNAPFVSRAEVTLVDRHSTASVTGRIKVVDLAGFTTFSSALIVSNTSEGSSHGVTPNAIGMALFHGTVPVATGSAISTRSGIRSLIVAN